MKKYTKPELELKEIETVNIIAVSPSIFGGLVDDDDFVEGTENYEDY